MTDASSQQLSRGPAQHKTRWLLKYGDRIYGPYSEEAMTGYIAEGRVIATSVVAPEGSGLTDAAWQPASTVEIFATHFSPAEAAEAKPAHVEPQPAATEAEEARAETAAPSVTPAATTTSPTPSADNDRRTNFGPGKGQTDRRRQPETSNFIVVMDVKSRYTGPLEEAIMSLGPAYKIAPNVWCVNADGTAAGLLNDLSLHIGKTDSMFIVDATRDRTAWHNLGPETDAKIRRVWRRAF